jgi:thiamine-phosphate pyrophosphorylase
VSHLYYITDRQHCPIPLLDNIKRVIDSGVDFIQIREKDLSARELLLLATNARGLCGRHQSRILINDRLDVALAADLNGIHLGQGSIEPCQIHDTLPGQDLLIGVSTHSLTEIAEAQKHGATFVTFGPVFFTPSKAKYGNPVGLDLLKKACHSTNIPVFALGGVDMSNYLDCLTHGAAGIAAIRLFQDLNIPISRVVREVRQFATDRRRLT